jgi:hypothetical protein
MAATFGAPARRVVLAVELLIFEFSTRALIPLMISASIAAGMHSLFFGSGPLFSVPAHRFAGLSQLPFYAVLGLSCGVLAVVINKGLFAIEDGFRRLPVSQFWWPAIGAVGFASVALVVPRALGVGYDQIGDVLNWSSRGRRARPCSFWPSWSRGGCPRVGAPRAGPLAPILLISGCFGALAGHPRAIVPGVHASGGGVRASSRWRRRSVPRRAPPSRRSCSSSSSQRDYNAILPLMLATVLACSWRARQSATAS